MSTATELIPGQDTEEAHRRMREHFESFGPRLQVYSVRSFKHPGKWYRVYMHVDHEAGIEMVGMKLIEDRMQKTRYDDLPPPVRAAADQIQARAREIRHDRQDAAESPGRKPCGGARMQTWLGVRWIGKPYPLRLRLRAHWWPIHVRKEPGCGCIYWLKRFIQITRGSWKGWRMQLKAIRDGVA